MISRALYRLEALKAYKSLNEVRAGFVVVDTVVVLVLVVVVGVVLVLVVEVVVLVKYGGRAVTKSCSADSASLSSSSS